MPTHAIPADPATVSPLTTALDPTVEATPVTRLDGSTTRAGGVFVSASSLVASYAASVSPADALKANGFSPRQVAVVEALRLGKPNKIIAYELNLQLNTVKVHVRNIMKKLHATNRTEVAYMATRLLNGEELAISN